MKASNFYSTHYKSAELVLLLILIGIVSRLLPHLPNFTPISALAIWGGMRLAPGKNVAFVIGTMLISDMFLGFHSTTVYVYGALLLTTILASRFKPAVPQITGMTLSGAILFFIVTNFGTWISTSMYPHTFAGLIQSYTNAIPFFRASLLGDIFYTVIIFSIEYVVLTVMTKQAIIKKSNS